MNVQVKEGRIMRQQKKWKYVFLSSIVFCILAGIFFIHPMKTQAASLKTGFFNGDNRVKTGNYYFWTSDNTIYASTSKTGTGKVVAQASKGHSIYYLGGFVTDGSVLYYTENGVEQGGAQGVAYIYSVKISGKNRTLIGKVKDGYSIQAYYKGKFYLAYLIDGDISCMGTYRFDMKTKKGKSIRKNAIPVDQYKQYLLVYDSIRWNPNGYIYNCKTEKFLKFSSNIGGALNFASGKVYYTEKINTSSVKIKSCSLAGKNKKTIVAKLSADFVGKITSKQVYYGKKGNFFLYNIKTKKSKKISENKFQWQ